MELEQPLSCKQLVNGELTEAGRGVNPRMQWSPPVSLPEHTGSLHMRKERSRDAARSRRGRENHEFYELAKTLPLPGAITSQLDKASIVRLTISFLKIGEFSAHGDPPWPASFRRLHRVPAVRLADSSTNSSQMYDTSQGTHILQSLDGFVFTLGADGRFLYISETVSIYLGLSQVEMCGSSIFDYLHAQDHAEFAEHTGLTLSNGRPLASPGRHTSGPVGTHNPDVNSAMTAETTSGFSGRERAICVRMKSTLTKRGYHFKTPGYRALLLQCRLRPDRRPQRRCCLLGLAAVAVALPPPTVHELRLHTDAFVTRLTFDFHITHCEPRVPDSVDFTADCLIGHSLYSLCHGADVQHVRKAHVDLLTKGQVLTDYYRLLNRGGGYSWLQTCATVVCSNKSDQDQMILCINYVLTRTELKGVVMESSLLDSQLCLKDENANESGGVGDSINLKQDFLSSGRALLVEDDVKIVKEIEMTTAISDCVDQLFPTHLSVGPGLPPRGQKRRHDIAVGPPDVTSGRLCQPVRRCGEPADWRQLADGGGGGGADLSSSCPQLGPRPPSPEGAAAVRPAAGRRTVIRSGVLSRPSELAPTPPDGWSPPPTAGRRPYSPPSASITPPSSVSPPQSSPPPGGPAVAGDHAPGTTCVRELLRPLWFAPHL